MLTRRLRLTGTVLLMAVALVTPTVVVTSAPASAQVVIGGCTIVSNPTPSNFTNCPGANLSTANLTGVNLSYANLAGATFVSCTVSVASGVECTSATLGGTNLTSADLSDVSFAVCFQLGTGDLAPSGCGESTLSGDDLTDANLANATFAVCTNSVPLSATQCGLTDLLGANLSGADLTGATLQTFCQIFCENANLTGATLTGANVTGTVLAPSDQTVVATSNAGAVVAWPTPSSLPGATPGACSVPSGSTFPLFSTTVTCQVLDAANDVATGTFQVDVAPTTQYFTRVLVPSDGATLAGAPYLDAAAGDAPGVTHVVFELSGVTLSNQVIATATPTLFGWVAKWNTTSVPNGTYSLQSVATDANSDTDTSAPISVTVENLTTAVLIPSGGASLSGATALLDASASSAIGIASVTFEVSGTGLTDQVVATATPTIYGYLAQWNTTAVPNGTYSLQSVATDTVAQSTTSAPVSVTVDNPPPSTTVLIPSGGATQSGTAALLDASASANVPTVTYELTGGTLANQVIATGTPTLYGWLARWNTTTVPNGIYQLNSVASYANGESGTSPPITFTVNNPVTLADLAQSNLT
jgi:uncharacterized protein YjbI with pentapeptide repeats